jgi:hypothetical protein
MKKFLELVEAKGKTAVFTFGRFNPPTTGHEKLILKVADVAKKEGTKDYFIYPSHSQNQKKDPLPHSLKIAYMRKMFPKHSKNIVAGNERTAIEIAVSLYKKGFTNIVMVVGGDRVKEFESLLNKYNGKEARHGFYDFESIKIQSAGERDPDAEDVTGMSASKMRAAATSNDKESFMKGLPSGFKDGEKLYKDVRKHMGIVETFSPIPQMEMTEEDVLRDMFLRGEIYNIGDMVEHNETGVGGEIVRRGTNYVIFAEESGATHRAWLHDIHEMTTGQLIKKVLSKTTKKTTYDKAVEVLKKIIDKKVSGGRIGHSIEYYASEIIRTSGIDLDARTLADRFRDKYPKVVKEVAQDPDIKDREGTQPKKYYAKDAEGDEMSKSTKAARARHFEKGAEKDDDDPSAYKPAPGDKSAKTKPSKHTKKYQQMYGEEQLDEKLKGIVTKAEKSGISYSILKKVYDRGVAAWRTGHRPGTTPEQWGYARVNSFITGGKTRTTADADLWKQHKGESFEIGTDEYAKHTKKYTPGQMKEFKDFFSEPHTDLIQENIYRVGSEQYFAFFNEKREQYEQKKLSLDGFNKELIESDIGKFDMFEGNHVPLDCPMMEEDDKELNSPKRGGPKKFYVYVKDPSTGNVKKVSFGDTSGLKAKIDDPEARKSFVARHKCSQQNDKTTAAYWSCRLPRYAKQLGLSGGGNFFW